MTTIQSTIGWRIVPHKDDKPYTVQRKTGNTITSYNLARVKRNGKDTITDPTTGWFLSTAGWPFEAPIQQTFNRCLRKLIDRMLNQKANFFTRINIKIRQKAFKLININQIFRSTLLESDPDVKLTFYNQNMNPGHDRVFTLTSKTNPNLKKVIRESRHTNDPNKEDPFEVIEFYPSVSKELSCHVIGRKDPVTRMLSIQQLKGKVTYAEISSMDLFTKCGFVRVLHGTNTDDREQAAYRQFKKLCKQLPIAITPICDFSTRSFFINESGSESRNFICSINKHYVPIYDGSLKSWIQSGALSQEEKVAISKQLIAIIFDLQKTYGFQHGSLNTKVISVELLPTNQFCLYLRSLKQASFSKKHVPTILKPSPSLETPEKNNSSKIFPESLHGKGDLFCAALTILELFKPKKERLSRRKKSSTPSLESPFQASREVIKTSYETHFDPKTKTLFSEEYYNSIDFLLLSRLKPLLDLIEDVELKTAITQMLQANPKERSIPKELSKEQMPSKRKRRGSLTRRNSFERNLKTKV